jgi:hypothetical protein
MNAPAVAKNRIILAASIIEIVAITAVICSRKAGLEACEVGTVAVARWIWGAASVAGGDEVAGSLSEGDGRGRSANSVRRFEPAADAVKSSSFLGLGVIDRGDFVAHRDPPRELVEHLKLGRKREWRVVLLVRFVQYPGREQVNSIDQSRVFVG